MSLGKKDIVKNISTKAHLKHADSSSVLEEFLSIVKKKNKVKISSFGVFSVSATKPRIGRNPVTKEEYQILRRKKLTFKASNYIKSVLN